MKRKFLLLLTVIFISGFTAKAQVSKAKKSTAKRKTTMTKTTVSKTSLPTPAIIEREPTFSAIGEKTKSEGYGFVTTHCLYVQASNYDVNNPKHFDYIRAYVRSKANSYPDDFVDIFFYDGYRNLDNCSCGEKLTTESMTHLIGSANINERVAANNYKRAVFINANGMYGYDGTNIPIGVKFNLSREDITEY